MIKTFLMLCVIFQFLLSLSFASASPDALTESKEKAVYTLDCSGIGTDWSNCYEEAETLCPDGYSYIKKSTGVVATPINGRSFLVPSKELVIECK